MINPIMLAHYSILTLRTFRIEQPCISFNFEAYGLDHKSRRGKLNFGFHKFKCLETQCWPLTTQHFVL